MEPIDELLELRRHRSQAGHRAFSVLTATALHVFALALAILAPRLSAQRQEPIEYVAVALVPAPAVAVATPRPPPATEAQPPLPEAQPQTPALAASRQERPAVPEESSQLELRPRPTPKPTAAEPSEARRGSTVGSPRSSVSVGAAVAGFDSPDFTYGYYVDQMLSLIRAQWSRPPLGGGVEVMVHYRIQSDGQIRDLHVATSSGYNSFDLAGLRAVQSAAPFPPLPRSYREGSLGVNLIFR